MTVDSKDLLLPTCEPERRPRVLRVGPADPDERLRVAFLLDPLRSILSVRMPDHSAHPGR